TVLNQVRDATKHLVGLDIAVMGCIVNGPGEMADADYGYVGRGGGKIALYRHGQLVKNDIPAERGVEELIALLKADGVWRDPE
ncbi:MAG: flavodoxin-dependent (E)-4-hydroxy-3-methylbut-2-enyl-diphosphate synthase, partial [Fimbriimonadales bacterium]